MGGENTARGGVSLAPAHQPGENASLTPAPRIAAAILAGGSGLRLGGETLKPFLTVLGHPLIHFSLRVFESVPDISSICIAVPEMHGSTLERLLTPYPRRAYKGWVVGGATRAHSALAALKALEEDAPDVVFIHDGARPLVTKDDIAALLAALPGKDGAILGAPSVDTLWRAEEADLRDVLERRGMVRAFTPQVFPYATIREALERGIAEGFEGTDDASYVRRLGGKIAWVQGSRWNVKVTYPEDLVIVEAILEGEGCA